jgi:hypothetical protein
MAARKGSDNQKNGNGDTVGFEAKLGKAIRKNLAGLGFGGES